MKVYIAGPMSGYPRFNFDAFDAAATMLRESGHIPINPAEIDRLFGIDPDTFEETEEFRRNLFWLNLASLYSSDGIYLLDGWEHSRGACLEFAAANYLKLPRY